MGGRRGGQGGEKLEPSSRLILGECSTLWGERERGTVHVVSGPLFLAQRRKESGQQPILFLCTRNFNCGRSVSNTYVTLSVAVTLRSDRLA